MAPSFLTGTGARFAFTRSLSVTFDAIFSNLPFSVALWATDNQSPFSNRAFTQAFVAVEFQEPRAFTLLTILLSSTLTLITLHSESRLIGRGSEL